MKKNTNPHSNAQIRPMWKAIEKKSIFESDFKI